MFNTTILNSMIGVTFTSVTADYVENEILFESDIGVNFKFSHFQNCCETVTIEDICGDLKTLTGSPIITAEERSRECKDCSESGTWTFYEFATNKGSVTIRWLGESNGYYSERVEVEEIIYDIELHKKSYPEKYI